MATNSPYRFDTSNVDWKNFVTEGVYYKILNINVEARTADLLAKFAPGKQCLYHRHVAPTISLVLEGALHIIEKTPEGDVHKVKTAGTFSSGSANEIHIEGGGDEGAIVLFSFRGTSDGLYDLLNEDLSLMQSITVQDFARELEHWAEAA